MSETPLSPDEGEVRVRHICSPSKPQLLQEQLAALARQLGPGAKLPRVEQLCQGFTVARATLNRALHDLETDGLIVRRHGVGIFVADSAPVRKGGRVLLLCEPGFFASTSHSPFWDLLVGGLRERATQHKGAFEIHFSQPRGGNAVLVSSLLADITAGKVAGLISVGLPQEENALLQEQVPLVAFASWARYVVRIDELEAVRLGVRALASKGCRRLELWADAGPTRFSHQGGQRKPLHEILLRVWQEALEAHNLPVNPDSLRNLGSNASNLFGRIGSPAHPTLQERGFSVACQTFGSDSDRKNAPDGVVVLDDMIARGALVALGRLGVEPGRDVHLATHANAGSDALLGFEDKLTRLEFAPEEVASALFDTLDALIAGEGNVAQLIEVRPRLKEANQSLSRFQPT